jgi:L-threonylcarbamoyladenylate synthase
MVEASSQSRETLPSVLRRPLDASTDLHELARIVRGGGLLAIPTESSYGLAVDPRSSAGVGRVYAIKGRERGKPLPVVAATIEQLADLGVDLTHPLIDWARDHWPAALSVVVPLAAELPASGGSMTLAVRIPQHRELRRLLIATGPLTATSANRSGEPPILDPASLLPLLEEQIAVLVDAGKLSGGQPSTLISWHDGRRRVLRHGAWQVEE